MEKSFIQHGHLEKDSSQCPPDRKDFEIFRDGKKKSGEYRVGRKKFSGHLGKKRMVCTVVMGKSLCRC
jgi:hypothetical protein